MPLQLFHEATKAVDDALFPVQHRQNRGAALSQPLNISANAVIPTCSPQPQSVFSHEPALTIHAKGMHVSPLLCGFDSC